MYCELVGFFVSLDIPPKIRFGSQNEGNTPTKIWLKYKIFRKFTPLWALQNLMFWKNIARVLMRVNWAGFTQLSRLNVWQSHRLVGTASWTQEHFYPFGKDCPYGPESLHRIFRQTAGGTYQRQHPLPDVLRNHDRSGLSHNQLQDSQCHPQ